MAELPKLVRERLRHPGATEHPDANLLSGFAEHTLTEQERAPVLDHLSRCAQCRQIVALSTPEVEQEALVAVAVAQRSWWRSPIVHWGALTAAALVVLIAVGERMRLREGRSASAPVIRYEPPATQSTPAPEIAATTQPRSTEAKQHPATAPPSQAAKPTQAIGAPVPHQTFSSPNARDTMSRTASPDKIAAGSGAGPAAPVPPPPAALPMKPHENAEAGKIDGPIIESGQQAQMVPALPATTGKVTAEAAAPVISNSQRQAPLLRAGKATAKSVLVSPRWSISDSGSLQRSFDGGRSWKEVAVAAGVTFRAVSVVANDVWVGGSGGALFHSADGGEHWTRGRIQMDGRGLNGDIVSIEFTDAANGVVSTSAGETWRTLDAGVSWQLQ